MTGFETAEVDVILDEAAEVEAPDSNIEDEVPPLPDGGLAVTRAGDLWQLGRHRLLCADATRATSYGRLLGQDKAAMIFTDPPYNVPIAGHVSGLGKQRQLVLAPFAASGTTVIAAEKTGRCARVLELDPLYCDTIVRRWQAFTGKQARHLEGGRSFEEVEEQRADDVLEEVSSRDRSGSVAAPGQGAEGPKPQDS